MDRTQIQTWYDKQCRLKNDKVVVKLHRSDGSLLDSVNIPTVMWPLAGPYEVFGCNNCQEISDPEVVRIINEQAYRIGHCYQNATNVTEALCKAGYNAKFYAGWMFIGSNQHPLHHAWTVLDGVHIIDLAEDLTLQDANAENFKKGKTDAERRALHVSFTKWSLQFPHSERCIPFGIPAARVLYVGCPDTRERAINEFNSLMHLYPEHPCCKKTRINGMTEMQAMLAEEGIT